MTCRTTASPSSRPPPLSSYTHVLKCVFSLHPTVCSEDGYIAHLGYPITNTRAAIPNITRLLAAFRAAQYPVYHTREGHRPDLSTLTSRELFRSRNNPSGLGIGDRGPLGRLLVRGEPGHDVIRELYPLPNEPVVDKPGRSAFAYTDFELLLKVRGVTKLVVCGVTADVCVHSTIREGNDRGYECLLVEDATGSVSEELRRAAVEMMEIEGGIFGAVARTDDVLAALEKMSD